LANSGILDFHMKEGPRLETLTRRLAECPADFLAEPRVGSSGVVQVAAVVSDLLSDLGGDPLSPEQARLFQAGGTPPERNRLRLVLVASWLLHEPSFKGQAEVAQRAMALLTAGLSQLAELVSAPQFVGEPERREELARWCLMALDLRPAGETLAQAQDRLTTLNSIERQRVIKAARQAEARARQVREAMAREAAKEASLKAMRE
jgi:hypothetical protein